MARDNCRLLGSRVPLHSQLCHGASMTSPAASSHDAMPMREFVAMMAAIMALNALAIDTMLPALPDMARELGATSANAQQYVISLYFLGLGVGSLVHGPLADRYGRKRVIMVCLVGYIIAGLASGVATSWPLLLGARFIHGLFGAAMGVVSQAIIRDRTSGDAMAKLMSMIFLIFMVVPIIAPTIGQGVLLVAHWRWIFLMLAGGGALMALWVGTRLQETLDPADVAPISPRGLARTWTMVATHRSAMAYMLGSSIAAGANFGFLNSSQQIFSETFGRADIFPLAFASVAGTMAIANFSNSRIVLRFGARRVSQAALIGFILISILQWIAAGVGEPMLLFIILIALNMSMIGFIGANFSSIAMEPFGHVAGSASSFQNSVRTLVAAGVGALIGQMYDGSTQPLAMGFACCGLIALAVVAWGERGKLFTRPNPPRIPTPRV